MPVITLRFVKSLEERQDFQQHFGVRFHRWHPIHDIPQSLKPKFYPYIMKFGLNEDSIFFSVRMIEYDAKRKEVDSTIMN